MISSIMQSYPLPYLSLEEAIEKQFKLVEVITSHFRDNEFLSYGDVGLNQLSNAPLYTRKVEAVLAEYFSAESCVLVRGAGSGALRYALISVLQPKENILLHNAEIYPTTAISINSMGLEKIFADFNSAKDMENILAAGNIKTMLLQISRQKLSDSYDATKVIDIAKTHGINNIITDDNYTVMKVKKIGVEIGADLSTFSLFKLLGSQGIGCILGKKYLIDEIKNMNYSGGSAVQGFEAMECLRGLVYTPVTFALQAKVLDAVLNRLNNNEIQDVESAVIANTQSRVIIVKLKKAIAKQVINNAVKFGAVNYPVGAESKFEITPMFYRCSSTLLKENPQYADYLVRINPMRAGVDTTINILKRSIAISTK